jgi:two-component system sensor histidine kinase BaeS
MTPFVDCLTCLTIQCVRPLKYSFQPPFEWRLHQRLTLQHKVLIALIALTMSLLVVFATLSHWGLQHSLGDYVAEVELSRMDWLVNKLERGYDRHGGWQFLEEDPKAWRLQRLIRLPGRPHPSSSSPSAPVSGQPPLRVLPDPLAAPAPSANTDDLAADPDSVYGRMALLNADATARLAGSYVAIETTRKRALHHKDKVVGYLAIAPLQSEFSKTGKKFISAQLWFVVLTGFIGGILALTFSWVLTRRWLIPIHQLMAGAQAVAQGKLQTQVPVHGHDELAHLTLTFNAMTQRLAKI